jgi:hypothetical protein
VKVKEAESESDGFDSQTEKQAAVSFFGEWRRYYAWTLSIKPFSQDQDCFPILSIVDSPA